jgi:hypothetical protein
VINKNTTIALTVVLIKSPDLKAEACPLQNARINLDGKG